MRGLREEVDWEVDGGGRRVTSSVQNFICTSKIERFVRVCVSFIIVNFSIQKLCADSESFLCSASPSANFHKYSNLFWFTFNFDIAHTSAARRRCLLASGVGGDEKVSVKLSWNCGCRSDFHSIQFDYCMLICLIQLQLLLLLSLIAVTAVVGVQKVYLLLPKLNFLSRFRLPRRPAESQLVQLKGNSWKYESF